VAQPPGDVEEGALDCQHLEGGVTDFASPTDARHGEDVAALEKSISQRLDIGHTGSPRQGFGHQARHVATCR